MRMQSIAPFTAHAWIGPEGDPRTAPVRVVGMTTDYGQPRFVAMRTDRDFAVLEVFEVLKFDVPKASAPAAIPA